MTFSSFRHNLRKDIEDISLRNFSVRSLTGEDVLQGIDYDFKRGEVYRIKGALGDCSEFLKALGFIHKNSQGSILVNGEDAMEFSFEEFTKYRFNIGYTFDYGGLLNNKTIKENITLPLQYHNEFHADEIEEAADWFLSYFDINQFANLRPAMTPGFVRKLGCIIRCLIVKPQVLVMDGPTAALDKIRSENLVRYIYEKFETTEIRMILFSTSYDGSFEPWSPKTLEIKEQSLNLLPDKVAV